MPGLPCTMGAVTRVDVTTPFFLRPVNFDNDNPLTKQDYSWETTSQITLLVKKKHENVTRNTPTNREGESVEGPSVAGCPLECPFDPNENFDEALKIIKPEQVFPGLEFPMDVYECLDLDTCRKILKKIYLRDRETLHSLGLEEKGGKLDRMNPVYLACDGATSDPEAKDLVMLGYDNAKFLELRMMGPYDEGSVWLDMKLFDAFHLHLPHVFEGIVRKKVHAVYEKPHGDFVSEGRVYLEFIWSEPKVVFEPPPVANAQVKLSIKPRPGDANPLLKRIWEEVEDLEWLIQLREMNQSRELSKSYHYNVSLDGPSEVVDGLKNLMTLPSIPVWNKETDVSNTVDTVLKRVIEADRSDLDFTDKAWSILRKARTVVEIYESFFHLLESIEDKKYRPYLYPSNKTIFSTVLKEQLTEKIKNFRTMFTPALALDLTVDCGIHKLFRDYSFALKMSNLAQPSELGVFTPKLREFREALHSLKKLHSVFEVLCLSKERLALNMSEQESQAQIVLAHLAKNPLDWDFTYHFDVPIIPMEPIIKGLTPIYWNLSLESSSVVRTCQTNAVISKDFYIHHANKHFVTPDRTLPRGYYLYVHRVAQRKTS